MVAAISHNKTHAPDPFDAFSATFKLSSVDAQTLELAKIGLDLANINHKTPILGYHPGAPARENVKGFRPNTPDVERLVIHGWVANLIQDQGATPKPYRAEYAAGGWFFEEVGAAFSRSGIARLDLQVAAPPEVLDSFECLPFGIGIQVKSTLDLAQTALDRINPRIYPHTGELFIRWLPGHLVEKNILSVTGLLAVSGKFQMLR